jgi:acyl-CoA thioester hydrolase
MEGYFESFRGHVLNSECDLIGHMNVQFYDARISQAMQSMFTHIGFSADRIKSTNKGFAAIDQKSRYCGELRADDIMHMQSAFANFTNKSITIHHRLLNSATQDLSYESLITVLYFDMNIRKAISFEQDTLDLLATLKLPTEVSL